MKKALFKSYFIMAAWKFFEIFFKIRYRFHYIGLENIPKERAVMLLGNHVSWIDWFILQLPIKRRINYVIDKDIYKWRLFNWAFRMAELIPVSKKASKDSFIETSKRLKNGRIIAIFPEGEISRSANIAKFYRGYQYIDRDDAVIVPFHIDGVFGSLFARHKGDARRCFLKKREITVCFGEAIAEDIKADQLRERVIKLKRMKI
ncbi:MAG: 1-acyl-sn-glycerol-3-phosphate acyltransferase [Sulfurimonas sp.]|uniref:1-acyl-sn-glycerol-3-phosphate acyltransferase n=1 Tax=Sulfurimonas sp. TaxID=2022749 RepID=UPI0028CEA218|nr:1-acyl-sn-glycerol-3-phosphate acyltransferase [Sulfurimonas sp.]MDT8338352.1 1-acyl-sn-glycerol-3-phosphate acyltransferase [Sulfurimonas sp.]